MDEAGRGAAADDPFGVFGFAPSMDLDLDELERRYLAASRTTHPDFHVDVEPAHAAAMIARAATVNDAYRVLRDPWRRARLLCEQLESGVMERNKALDPAFLMDAMELAEQVATTDDAEREALVSTLQVRVDDQLRQVTNALRAGAAARAATLLHQSTYLRKALADASGAGR